MNTILNKSYVASIFIAVLVCGFAAQAYQIRIIGGEEAKVKKYREVVQIRINHSVCSAVVVGPRVILTAAHCGPTGSVATFEVKGKAYEVKIVRSPLYPQEDHDLAIGISKKQIKKAKPVSVGGEAVEGLEVLMLGWGATKASGGDIGVLHKGVSVITGFTGNDMVTKMEKGAALCWGDSGGPAYVLEDSKRYVLGIASKGNIQDTSYFARTDTHVSQDFFEMVTEDYQVDICGINLDC